MDILSIIILAFLTIASIQDIKKKAVDDHIHYIFLSIFIPYFLYLYITGYLIIKSIVLPVFIFSIFILLYVFRLLAIGDIYIMFSITLLLFTYNSEFSIKFLIFTFLSTLFVNNLEFIKLFKRDKLVILSIFSLFFYFISIYYLILVYKEGFYAENVFYFLYSLIFTMISLLFFKPIENKMKEKLKFERKVSELIEGDWIEGEIYLSNIDENTLRELEKEFKLKKVDDKYIINFNYKFFDKEKIILLLIISAFISLSLILYYYFVILYIFIIIILTIFHDKIFRGDLGLSKKQIELLRKIDENNIKVRVIEGSPFIPAILIGYILSFL